MADGELADSVSTLLELSSLRQSLQKKLQILQCQSVLSGKENQTHKELTDADLNNEIDDAKQELINAQNGNANRARIGKMLIFSQEAFKSVCLNQSTVGADDLAGDYNGSEIATKLMKLNEINGDVSNQLKILSRLQSQYESTKVSLQDIEWKNRDLAILVENAESNYDVTVQRTKAEERHTETRGLMESLNKSLKDLKLRHEVFQRLIHASKVDWITDDELTDLMVALGDEICLNDS